MTFAKISKFWQKFFSNLLKVYVTVKIGGPDQVWESRKAQIRPIFLGVNFFCPIESCHFIINIEKKKKMRKQFNFL